MSTAAPARRATWHDAFDAQMALWRWTRPDTLGEKWLAAACKDAGRNLHPTTQRMQVQLYSHINRMLLDADPVYVSGKMCELVDAARHGFAAEPLLPTDLITAHGFLYLEQPLVLRDKWGQDSTISALSWSPLVGTDPDVTHPEIGHDPLAYFKGRDYTTLWAKGSDDEPKSQIDGIVIVLWQPAVPGTQAHDLGTRHIPLHVTPWWFGMEFDGNERDEKGDPTGAEWWWRMAQTMFRLMMQQISQHTHHRPDRATRREAQRRGWRERDIVVVRLRRERDPSMPDDGPHEEAHYSHQFVVGGHWRNQWYPASAVHRQIWISDYIKGPEGAPLLVRPRRVYTWTR